MKREASAGAPDRAKDKSTITITEMGHLASGVGHHVINAFSAVVSNAEILRLKLAMPDPPDPSVMADAIIRTAVEAAGVARRLIDVTRPITVIGEEHVALDSLISDYAASRRAEGEGVRWEVDASPVPPILGKVDHLRSMLDYLAANAIEAAGSEELRIRLSTSQDNRGWVVLDFVDNGQGMPHGVVERAVEPFFSTKTGHLGVGLSIANGIWRRHKGTLSIRSRPGEGTTVRLSVEAARTSS